MKELRLTQSDVASRIWGTTTDNRGHTVARRRERIHAYVNGNAVPSRDTLLKLAEVLEMDVHELAPDLAVASAARKGGPAALQITMVEGHEGQSLFQVNTLLPVQFALELGAVLNAVRSGESTVTLEYVIDGQNRVVGKITVPGPRPDQATVIANDVVARSHGTGVTPRLTTAATRKQISTFKGEDKDD